MLGLFAFFLLGIAAQGQPVVTLSTTSLAFGSQTIGTTSPAQIVTLTNTGTTVLNITSIVLQGAVSDFTQTNNCGSTVGAGASCTFTVTFSPDLAVTRTATIVITDNALPKQQKINLSGTGVVSVVRLSPPNVVFNKQAVGTASGARTVTLTNTGATPLTISSVVASANFGQTNNCGASVAAGGACSISVTFTPSAIWTQTGAITITDSSQDTPQIIPLAGMGTGKAVASLSVQSLSFGSQAIGSSSSPQAVTLTNTGTDVLTINSVIVSGDYSQTTTCGSTISAGANCSITVAFTPSAAGVRSGYLTLNDTASPFLQTVTLTGTGTASTTTVAISPRVASVTLTQAQRFSATISGIGSTDVIWAVDGIAGGSASSGMIDSTGLYTPPSAAGLHQITATSIADPSQSTTVPVTVTTFAGVLTYKNDNQHTGQNLTETVLTTGSVNANQFGKLFSYPVDGYVFAQPLYVPSMSIPTQGVHNVVYVATEHDSVFAFDADNLTPVPLWQTSFIDPAEGITTVPAADVEGMGSDIPTEIGITPTPVIDLSRNAIYVLARTKEVSGSQTSYVQRLHALDLTTGAELAGSPVVISAQVSGIGAGSSRGIVAFDGKRENSRPGLLLLNGVVYAGWASLGDIIPFHGWVLGYDGGSLEQVTVFNTTPNGSDGGIWQSGGGLAADDNGNIFAIVGNGDFDVAAGGIDYGDSVLRLTNNSSSLSVGDYFTPYNQATFDNSDLDLGSGGPLLLPDQPGTFPHLMVLGGKDATLYLINRDNLGQFNHTGNNVPMYVPSAVGKPGPGSSGNHGTPAYWQGQVYFTGSTDVLKAFGLYNGLLSASPLAMGSVKYNYPGGEAAISANGNTNGILWVLQADQFKISGPVVLRAYDAANVSRELFDSTTLSANTAGPAVKFSVPTIANAKVYVGTQTELDVFGLLP